MVTVDTSGLGTALNVGTSVYGSGSRAVDTPNSGLRPYYEWGLWGYCASQSKGGDRDFCVGNDWGFKFQPVPAILYDAPATNQNAIATALGSGTFTSSDYLGSYT